MSSGAFPPPTKPQTFKPYSLAADDITDIMVCQTLKPYKKIPHFREKLSIIVIYYLKCFNSFKYFLKPFKTRKQGLLLTMGIFGIYFYTLRILVDLSQGFAHGCAVLNRIINDFWRGSKRKECQTNSMGNTNKGVPHRVRELLIVSRVCLSIVSEMSWTHTNHYTPYMRFGGNLGLFVMYLTNKVCYARRFVQTFGKNFRSFVMSILKIFGYKVYLRFSSAFWHGKGSDPQRSLPI